MNKITSYILSQCIKNSWNINYEIIFQVSSCFRGDPAVIPGNPWGRSPCSSWDRTETCSLDWSCHLPLCRHCLSHPRDRGLREWRRARSSRVGRLGRGRWLKESRDLQLAGRQDETVQEALPSSLHLCIQASTLHLPTHSLTRACPVLTRGVAVIRRMSGRTSR